jgi:pyruvyltransferase
MIEKVFCLSLKESTARRAIMTDQLKKIEDHTSWEFVGGVKYDDDEVYDTMRHLSSSQKRTSVVAISLAHTSCLQKVVDCKYTVAGIVEDDVILVDNFYDKLESYFDKTPEVLETMKTKPCIVFLAGITSIKKREAPSAFVDIGPQAGLYFYLINHLAAQLLIDNLYPITRAYDGYMMEIAKKLNIKTFSALPVLCYDLSSPFYRKFWTEEDKLLRKNIKSLSIINKPKELSSNLVYCGDSDGWKDLKSRRGNKSFGDLLNIAISKKFTENEFNLYKTNNCTEDHFLFIGSTLRDYCNEHSVICGTGIESLEDTFKKPKAVSFVRGPLTRQRFLDQGYACPEIYGDPTLIMSKIYRPSIKKTYTIGITPFHKDFDKIKELVDKWNLTGVLVIDFNVDYNQVKDTLNKLLSCKYIVSSSLVGLMLAHTYGIRAIWTKGLSDSNNSGKFLDYLASVKIINATPLTLNQRLLDNIEDTVKEYPNPNRTTVNILKKNIVNNTLFNKKLSRV